MLDIKKALRHLRRVDQRFAMLIDQHGPADISKSRNYFRSLATAIIYQQLSGKAAATIHGRFVTLFTGGRFPKPTDVLDVPH